MRRGWDWGGQSEGDSVLVPEVFLVIPEKAWDLAPNIPSCMTVSTLQLCSPRGPWSWSVLFRGLILPITGHSSLRGLARSVQALKEDEGQGATRPSRCFLSN